MPLHMRNSPKIRMPGLYFSGLRLAARPLLLKYLSAGTNTTLESLALSGGRLFG